jgi:hypothetical protein
MASIHPTRHGTFEEIVLTGRKGAQTGTTRVDPEDYEALAAYRWHLTGDGYAARAAIRPDGRGYRTMFMHREILGLEVGDPRCGDHINRDKLDNRRSNLRIVSRAQNRQNVPAQGPARIRGVSWDGQEGRWRARVGLDGRQHFLGYFDDPAEAGKAAAEFRASHLPFSEEVTI